MQWLSTPFLPLGSGFPFGITAAFREDDRRRMDDLTTRIYVTWNLPIYDGELTWLGVKRANDGLMSGLEHLPSHATR